MERKNNYLIRREEAKKRFLTFAQEPLIDRWHLKADDAYIYVTFLQGDYRIDRKSAQVERMETKDEAGFEEVLSIFDLLCRFEGELPQAGTAFAPVNSLNGRPKTIGVGSDFHSETAKRFDENWEAFLSACASLGGTPVKLGDAGFEFTVFQDLKLRLKFYRADEEFPAQLIILWNENALQYMFYETTFYTAGYLCEKIAAAMEMKDI